MKQVNHTSSEDFEDWVNLSEISSKLKKDAEDYINWDENFKQEYWNSYFVRWLLPLWSIEYPVDISDFRKSIKNTELNFERFLPWIIKAMEEFTGEEWVKIEDIFILDEQAKKYLATHSSLNSHSKQVESIVNWNTVKKNKTSSIEWVDLRSEELAERVWDLFYDSLAGFISLLWHEIREWNKELSQVWEYLKKASFNVYNAWVICQPYVWEWFPNLKHSHEIKWVEISREELVERIVNLTDERLKKFLLDLSKKIHKDWLADEWRWRKKLSTELFEASKNIELAWNSL